VNFRGALRQSILHSKWLVLNAPIVAGFKRPLTDIETEFWTSLRNRFQVRLISPTKTWPIPPVTYAVGCLAVLTSCVTILYKTDALVFICALPYLIFSCLYFLLPLLYEHQPTLTPRIMSAAFCANITFLNSSIILVLAFGFFMSVINQFPRAADNTLRLTVHARVRQYIAADGPLLDRVTSGRERLARFRAYTRSRLERFKKLAPYLEQLVIVGISGATIGVLCLIFYLAIGVHGKTLAKIPDSWRAYIGQSQVDWIRLPPELEMKGIRNVSFRLAIVLLFTLGALLNMLALAAAVEAMSFALTGHTVFSCHTQAALTWAFVPFLLAGELTKTADTWIWDGLARFVIAIPAMPALIILARRVLGAFCECIRRLYLTVLGHSRNPRIDSEIADHIRKLSRQHGIRCPWVVRTREKAIRLAIVPGFAGLPPILLISRGAFSRFTKEELMAATAHELGHIKQVSTRLYFLRALPILASYPQWFLLLWTDLRAMEEEADKFALRAGADPRVLTRAIIKSSFIAEEPNRPKPLSLSWLHRCLSSQLWRPLVRLFKPILVMDRFLCSDDLLSYSHPVMLDRIAAILSHSGGKRR